MNKTFGGGGGGSGMVAVDVDGPASVDAAAGAGAGAATGAGADVLGSNKSMTCSDAGALADANATRDATDGSRRASSRLSSVRSIELHLPR